MTLKNGRYGSFLACSNYPNCNYTKALSGSADESQGDGNEDQVVSDLPKILGTDHNTNEEILLKKGPYGIYLQRGDGKKIKRASLPKGLSYQNLDLDYAINLLNMPREVGVDQEGVVIKAGIGKFGPYLERSGKYISLRASKLDPVLITIEQACEIVKKNATKIVRSNKK